MRSFGELRMSVEYSLPGAREEHYIMPGLN